MTFLSGRWRGLWYHVLLLMTVTVCTVRTFGNQIDDAFIYYRYARNVLNGAGPVYNPGEMINALASWLYLILLLPGEALAMNPGYAHILNALICYLLALACGRLLQASRLPPAGSVTAFLVAGYLPFHLAAGLEMPSSCSCSFSVPFPQPIPSFAAHFLA
ncbi:hypothetical protein JW905_11570 [bacterium]|nr:hypothetical protein [candidate division CSSED10-310 bacterium]